MDSEMKSETRYAAIYLTIPGSEKAIIGLRFTIEFYKVTVVCPRSHYCNRTIKQDCGGVKGDPVLVVCLP